MVAESHGVQGEVEQISMMKPKALTPHETGLLEYLEDIIGTDKYVEHIEAGAKRCFPHPCSMLSGMQKDRPSVGPWSFLALQGGSSRFIQAA